MEKMNKIQLTLFSTTVDIFVSLIRSKLQVVVSVDVFDMIGLFVLLPVIEEKCSDIRQTDKQ